MAAAVVMHGLLQEDCCPYSCTPFEVQHVWNFSRCDFGQAPSSRKNE